MYPKPRTVVYMQLFRFLVLQYGTVNNTPRSKMFNSDGKWYFNSSNSLVLFSYNIQGQHYIHTLVVNVK